jgi:putative endonuclease
MYTLYILKCKDQTLYTGITTDLKRRMKEHNTSNLGAKYTRSRRPVKATYRKNFRTQSAAAREEARIKKLPRVEKLKLIKKTRP